MAKEKNARGTEQKMERANSRLRRMTAAAAGDLNIPKFRSIADERLSQAIKRAVNRQKVPLELEHSIRTLLWESKARN